MMPVSYAGKLLSNCKTDLRLTWVRQQIFPMESPQAESPQVRHSLHQLEVQGGSLGVHGQRNVCAWKGGGIP